MKRLIVLTVVGAALVTGSLAACGSGPVNPDASACSAAYQVLNAPAVTDSPDELASAASLAYTPAVQSAITTLSDAVTVGEAFGAPGNTALQVAAYGGQQALNAVKTLARDCT